VPISKIRSFAIYCSPKTIVTYAKTLSTLETPAGVDKEHNLPELELFSTIFVEKEEMPCPGRITVIEIVKRGLQNSIKSLTKGLKYFKF
jgi:hypothetical protein